MNIITKAMPFKYTSTYKNDSKSPHDNSMLFSKASSQTYSDLLSCFYG